MEIQTLNPATPRQRQRIEAFLKRNALRIDDMNYYAAMLDDDGEMIAGGGLKDDVIKCVAVDDAHKGEAIANTLVSHLISHANQEGYGCIKLFTKPKNRQLFESLSFRLLAEAPEAILMETGIGGISNTVEALKKIKEESEKYKEYNKECKEDSKECKEEEKTNLNTTTPQHLNISSSQHLNTYNIMYNTENKQKGRFAPSPTGRMHLGNVFSALLSWLSIKAQGGDWVLRIEDIDPQRSHMEYADLIMSDLEWLGLTWDEGPFYQSERGEIYEAELQKLTLRGLTYPCYCTRADILATQAPHESDGRVVYKGTCRNLKPGTHSGPAAIRMRVPDEGEGIITFVDGHYGEQTVDLTTQCGDFIVRRKDGAWAYQLAVVVDDALMGITEVVRGRDLLLSSPQQIYLANQLGFVPPRFTHLPLLCNAAGQRLSKRDRSLDMEALRSRFEAEEIIGMLAYKAGLQESPERVTAEELVAGFDWSNIGITDIEF